jgi:hypothetical protein
MRGGSEGARGRTQEMFSAACCVLDLGMARARPAIYRGRASSARCGLLAVASETRGVVTRGAADDGGTRRTWGDVGAVAPRRSSGGARCLVLGWTAARQGGGGRTATSERPPMRATETWPLGPGRVECRLAPLPASPWSPDRCKFPYDSVVDFGALRRRDALGDRSIDHRSSNDANPLRVAIGRPRVW